MPSGVYKRTEYHRLINSNSHKNPSQQTRINMRNAQLGRTASAETRKKLSLAGKGRKHSQKTKDFLSEIHKGDKNAMYGKPSWNSGTKGIMKANQTSFRKGSLAGKRFGTDIIMAGDKHWNWKGGITPEIMLLRKSIKNRNWRKEVFERDDYRCLDCGERGGKLNADHIYPFAYFPRLRFDINNGQTLCEDCHKRTPTYGYKAKNYQLTN